RCVRRRGDRCLGGADRHQSARAMRAELRASLAAGGWPAHAPTALPPAPRLAPRGRGARPRFERRAPRAVGPVPPAISSASNPTGTAPLAAAPGTGPKVTPGATVALTPAPPPARGVGRVWWGVLVAVLLVAGVAGAWAFHGTRGTDVTAFQPPP